MTDRHQIRLLAPAKVNLGLEIVRRRPDGYHDLNTLFVALDVGDRLSLALTPDRLVHCRVRGNDSLPVDERNLAVAALVRLQHLLDLSEGFDLSIDKHLPVGGGLGGGSSDAATALRAAQRLLGPERLPLHVLHDVARSLGADVPFFLQGGIALGRGRGDDLTPVDLVLPWTLLLVNPGLHVSTPWAFQVVGRVEGDERPASDLEGRVRRGITDPGEISTMVVNDFEERVFRRYPLLADIKGELIDVGALFALLSGSGATLFGIFPDDSSAMRGAERFSGACWSALAHPALPFGHGAYSS